MSQKVAYVTIVKLTDHPSGSTRVFLGMDRNAPGEPPCVYCEYRGPKEDARLALEIALQAVQGMIEDLGPGEEPEIAPEHQPGMAEDLQ